MEPNAAAQPGLPPDLLAALMRAHGSGRFFVVVAQITEGKLDARCFGSESFPPDAVRTTLQLTEKLYFQQVAPRQQHRVIYPDGAVLPRNLRANGT